MSAADDLARLSADLDGLDRSLRAAETNLIDIDDAWNALSAMSPAMTGAAADRLQELHTRIGGLWEHWTALQSVLRRARDVADAGDARALAALLERDSVLVTGPRLALAQRTLTGGFRNEARYRPAQLLDDMSTTFADTRDKLDALAALRREVDGRVTKLHAGRDALQRGIDGEQADQAELAVVQLAVLEVDHAATDPISADVALVDATARIDALRNLLHERHIQRGGLADDLAIAARAAGDLQARAQTMLVDGRRMAAAYIGADHALADLEVAQRSARQLSSRLAELAARDVSDWRATVADLARWQREHDRLSAGLDLAARSLSAPADRRAELRGLLDAAKAKARERGCGEIEALTALADEALGLLRTVPADLEAAATAVTTYVEALRAQLSEGARP